MESRSSVYTQETNNTEEVFGSRTARNAGLYREIRETDLGNYNLRSNAKVIDNNSGNNIDIDHIKSILDTHYKDSPRIHTIPIEEDTPRQSERKTKSIFEITKEYDLNTILDKAKEGREENYQEDRVKKLHDTQFNILKDLNIDPRDYIEEYDDEDIEIKDTGVSLETSEETSRTLQDLIDTIALNEQEVRKELNKTKKIEEDTVEEQLDGGDTDPLDIFSDLKGNENTVTLEGLQEKTQELMDELGIKLDEEPKEIKHINTDDEDEEELEEKQSKTTSLDNEFFTTQHSFKKSDFEDFEDLDEDKKGGVFSKIIIAILCLVFLAGLFILIKSFF